VQSGLWRSIWFALGYVGPHDGIAHHRSTVKWGAMLFGDGIVYP
jgi:hypothetical protein